MSNSYFINCFPDCPFQYFQGSRDTSPDRDYGDEDISNLERPSSAASMASSRPGPSGLMRPSIDGKKARGRPRKMQHEEGRFRFRQLYGELLCNSFQCAHISFWRWMYLYSIVCYKLHVIALCTFLLHLINRFFFFKH